MTAIRPTGEAVDIAVAVGHRSDDVADALRELSLLLVAKESVETTLQRVADLARRTIPACDAAGVTLRRGAGYLTVAWTDRQTLEIDAGQYARDHGPCLEALRSGTIVRASLPEATNRWPEFAQEALARNVCSFLAAPLSLDGQGIGALNLYSHSADGFDALDDMLVAMFAAQATVALANAQVYLDAVTTADQLRQAMASRAVIEQAKGVLMARERITPDAAFDRLRTESQRRNTKLRDVAAQVVAATQPEDEPGDVLTRQATTG